MSICAPASSLCLTLRALARSYCILLDLTSSCPILSDLIGSCSILLTVLCCGLVRLLPSAATGHCTIPTARRRYHRKVDAEAAARAEGPGSAPEAADRACVHVCDAVSAISAAVLVSAFWGGDTSVGAACFGAGPCIWGCGLPCVGARPGMTAVCPGRFGGTVSDVACSWRAVAVPGWFSGQGGGPDGPLEASEIAADAPQGLSDATS